MKESALQKKIIEDLKGMGWLCLKLIQTNQNGIPDLEIIKDGRVIFLEIKTSWGRVSDLQHYRIEQLRNQNIETYVIKGVKEFEELKKMIQ